MDLYYILFYVTILKLCMRLEMLNIFLLFHLFKESIYCSEVLNTLKVTLSHTNYTLFACRIIIIATFPRVCTLIVQIIFHVIDISRRWFSSISLFYFVNFLLLGDRDHIVKGDLP